jgi:5-oxoprolinase (ATP-hydrolysing)
MPAFSKKLSEEGVAVEQFHLIVNGQFREAELRELFKQSRRLDDNVSDLLAQIAAN